MARRVSQPPWTGGRQFLDLDHAAGSDQHAAVGHQRAEGVEQPGPGIGRLDQTPHHLARQIVGQVVALVAAAGDGGLADGSGEDAGFRLEGFKLAFDQAVLIAAEIEQAADQDRQRQHVDRENPERQRREGAAVAAGRRTRSVFRSGAAASARFARAAGAVLPFRRLFRPCRRRQRPFKHRDSGNRRRTAFRSGRNRCLSP